jgi:5-methylcytosine-specific restriction endonuclease McrA
MELYIQKKDPRMNHAVNPAAEAAAPKKPVKPDEEAPVVRLAEVKKDANARKPIHSAPGRYIRAHDRRVVNVRAGHRCEYLHQRSGKRCESRTGLQMEHRIPFAKGGPSSEENLLLYCGAHNRLRAIQEFGEEKMRSYLKI